MKHLILILIMSLPVFSSDRVQASELALKGTLKVLQKYKKILNQVDISRSAGNLRVSFEFKRKVKIPKNVGKDIKAAFKGIEIPKYHLVFKRNENRFSVRAEYKQEEF